MAGLRLQSRDVCVCVCVRVPIRKSGLLRRHGIEDFLKKKFLATADVLAQRPWSLDNAAKYLRDLVNGSGHTNPPDVEWVFKAQRPHEFHIGIAEDISLGCKEPQPVHIKPAPDRRPKRDVPPVPLERAAPAAELERLQPGERLQKKPAAVLRRPAAAAASTEAIDEEIGIGVSDDREMKRARKVRTLQDLPNAPHHIIIQLGCPRCRHSKLGCIQCRAQVGIFWNNHQRAWLYIPTTPPVDPTDPEDSPLDLDLDLDHIEP